MPFLNARLLFKEGLLNEELLCMGGLPLRGLTCINLACNSPVKDLGCNASTLGHRAFVVFIVWPACAHGKKWRAWLTAACARALSAGPSHLGEDWTTTSLDVMEDPSGTTIIKDMTYIEVGTYHHGARKNAHYTDKHGYSYSCK
eukprot:1158576-Pelagomonas_calceolata.AAC.7